MIPVELPIAEIHRGATDPRLAAAVGELYRRLDEDIAARGAVCVNRGRCCRFAEFGHRLFVTSAELAYFLATNRGPLLAPADRSFCPYQQEGRCAARAGRPSGCRIFFCDPAEAAWQPERTEAALGELRAIGERFGLPYAYAEWTDALRQLGGAVVPPPAGEARPDRIDSPTVDP